MGVFLKWKISFALLRDAFVFDQRPETCVIVSSHAVTVMEIVCKTVRAKKMPRSFGTFSLRQQEVMLLLLLLFSTN